VAQLNLSIPNKRVSAWVAETDLRNARAWLDSLPLADSAEAAREIYQALYTLNRQDLDVAQRFELMELYARPVATVISSLQATLVRLAIPLPPKKRALAEFLRLLYLEMANGYKCCLNDLQQQRILWGKKQLVSPSAARALHFLGEALLRSYATYFPTPADIWRDVHALYRYAEETGRLEEIIQAPEGDPGPAQSIGHRYLQILLLAACNPYQLPPAECFTVYHFLARWAGQARLTADVLATSPLSQFLVDLDSDRPPIGYPRSRAPEALPSARRLDAAQLAGTVQGFIQHLEKGASVQSLDMGVDCLESACLDLMQRLMRAWGEVVRREHARIKRHGSVLICSGVNALHFFASGQKPFSAPDAETPEPVSVPDANVGATPPSAMPQDNENEEYVALDEPGFQAPPPDPIALVAAPSVPPVVPEIFRIDRWQIKDISPRGFLLLHSGEGSASVRVGDLIGVQRAGELEHWSVAAVRWLKSVREESVDVGIEVLSPRVTPVVVSVDGAGAEGGLRHAPALLLPTMSKLHRPATLVLPRGLRQDGKDMTLHDGDSSSGRGVVVLKMLERTSAFEQFVFAEKSESSAS
jgi:hypothetical protein